MESYDFESGNTIIKSMEIEDHGKARIRNSWRSPSRQWLRSFAHTHTSHDP